MGRNTVKRSFAVCLARYWFSYSVCASGQELANPCSCEKGISHTEGRSWYWSSYIRLGKPQTIYERRSSRRRSCCHKRTARKVETAAAVMRSQTSTSLQRHIKYEHENLLPRRATWTCQQIVATLPPRFIYRTQRSFEPRISTEEVDGESWVLANVIGSWRNRMI